MKFDPVILGFAWPSETTLTNPVGETMVVRPLIADGALVHQQNHQTTDEYRRHYSVPNGILTEREIKKWLVGGDEVTSRLMNSFVALFGPTPGTRLPLQHVIDSQGYSEIAISVTLPSLLSVGEHPLPKEQLCDINCDLTPVAV